MSRPAKYPDAASRQAAYRNRVYWQQPPTQKFLAGMAEGLHRDFAEAIKKGTCSLPAELLGAHAGQTLANLRDYLCPNAGEVLPQAAENTEQTAS
mgnify:CR=1 FL=1